MNILKNILGRILALWAIIVFVSSMLLIVIPSWLVGFWKEPRRSHIIFPFFRAWMKIFFVFTGVRRKYRGQEHFKKGETYVVVCNHISFMDPPLSSPGIPYTNKTIAKIEMARIPLFGVAYKRGSVLVDRKSDKDRKDSYLKMKEVLEMGLHMCIYPEGTRNKTNEPLQRFHDGAFKLAVESGKSIIPSLIFNTSKIMPPNKSFYFWPQKVEMHFLPPVLVEGKTSRELKDEVSVIMKNYYLLHQNEIKN